MDHTNRKGHSITPIGLQVLRLGRSSLLYGLGNVLNQLIGFLLLPLFTAYLTPKDFGIISILGFISFIAVPICGFGFGVSTGIVYFENESDANKNKAIWTSFTIVCLSSAALLFLTALFSPQISFLAFQDQGYGHFILVWLVGALLNTLLTQPFRHKLQFEERAKTFVILASISTLATAGLNILFVVFLKRGVEGFIWSTVYGSIFTFVLFILVVAFQSRFSLSMEVGKKLLKLGMPMIPSFAFLFVLQHSGRYVIQLYQGIDSVGIYTIGYNCGMVINIIVSAFTAAWYPFFNSFVNKQHEVKFLFGRVLTYYSYVFGILSFMFFVFAKPVITIMTQSSFHGAHEVVGLISLGYVFGGVFAVFLPAVYFRQRVYLTNFVQLLSAIFCVLLGIILVKRIGILGAGIAFAVANLIMMVLQHCLNRLAGYLEIVYEWKRVFLFLFSFLVFVVLKLSLSSDVAATDIGIGVSFAALFLVAVYSQLTRDERQYILKLVGLRKRG